MAATYSALRRKIVEAIPDEKVSDALYNLMDKAEDVANDECFRLELVVALQGAWEALGVKPPEWLQNYMKERGYGN